MSLILLREKNYLKDPEMSHKNVPEASAEG